MVKVARALSRMRTGIALLALVGLISGCAGQAKNTSGKAAAGSSDDVVTIEYWHINNESFGGPATQELIDKFAASHPNIKVVGKFNAGSYAGLVQNLQAAIAAKKPPAVAQIGYNMKQYVAQNIPHVSAGDLAKSTPDFFQTFYPNVLVLGQVDGKQEGVPYSLSNPIVYYNKDLFAQAGLDPDKAPQTWNEVRAASRQIKAKTGNFGFYMANLADNWTTQALIEGNGGRLLSSDGHVAFDGAAAVEAMRFWADLVNVDKVTPVMTNDEAFQAFLAGKIGMYVQTIAARSNVEKGAKFTVGTSRFPVFEGKARRVPGGGNNLMVFATDKKEQAAAWEFIKFLTSPEGLTVWTKGTGYLPVRQGVADDPKYLKGFLEENPLMAPAIAQLPDVVEWVSMPGKNGLQAEKLLVDIRQDILGGKQDAETALTEAAARAEALVKGQ